MKIDSNIKHKYTKIETNMKIKIRQLNHKHFENLWEGQKKHKIIKRECRIRRISSKKELWDKINGLNNPTEKLQFIKKRHQSMRKLRLKAFEDMHDNPCKNNDKCIMKTLADFLS